MIVFPPKLMHRNDDLGLRFGAAIDARNDDKKNVVDLAEDMKNADPEGGAQILDMTNELLRKRTLHQRIQGCLSSWLEARRTDRVRDLRLDRYNVFSTTVDNSLRYVLDVSIYEPRSQRSLMTFQRVKAGTFDVLQDRQVFLGNSNGGRDDLYLALAYALIAHTGIVSEEDVEASWFRYEDTLLSLPDPRPVDALYFVAHARLAQLRATPSSRRDLLLPMLLLTVCSRGV
jgi:hypothetical protein